MGKVITLSGLRGNMGAENPASANCIAQGGTEVIRKTAAGEYGVCVFPNGSECEEWALYRKECQPASATVEESQKTYPRLLNYGIAAGAGALVGLLVAASKSKKFVPRLAGAGVGAAVTTLILVLTWPKAPTGA